MLSYTGKCTVILASLFVILAPVGAQEAGVEEIGGYFFTEAQKEAARKLAAEASSAYPLFLEGMSVIRPRARPSDLQDRMGRALAKPSSEISLLQAEILTPPARLIGRGRDIPLRLAPEKGEPVVKLIRDQAINSEVILSDWYLVIVNGGFFYVHRDEVQAIPR